MKKNLIPPLISFALALTPGALPGADTTMTAGPSLGIGRMAHSVLTTGDGTVVVFGGHGPDFATLATAEMLAPGASDWTTVEMKFPHDSHAFVRLADGKLLIAGGAASLGIPAYDTVETFDLGTRTFSPAGTLARFRASSGAAQLVGGKVLLAGAWWNHNDAHTIGELYDLATGVSVATGPLNRARSGPLVFPTPDGNAVVVGGFHYTSGNIPPTPELFSAADSTFTKLRDELLPDDPGWFVGPSFSAVQTIDTLRLADGRYLVPMYRPLATATEQGLFTFDPATKAFAKFNTTPALPASDAEAFYFLPQQDVANHRLYQFALVPGVYPHRATVRTVDLVTGATVTLPGVVEFPNGYEISSASVSLLPDRRLLVVGGATAGNGNFGARPDTFFITPGSAGPTIALDIYPGVTITGNVGAAYVVEYSTALAPDEWLPLTTVTLTSSKQLVFDPTPLSGQAKRFYRAKPAN